MKKVNDTTKLNRNFVWVKHIIKTKNDKDITQNVVIGKKHLDTGLFLVSPYSDLPSSIKNKKITTQLAYANVVVPFLNFLYDKDSAFEIDNISIQDGIEFLTSCDVNSKTKQGYAATLEKFYMFLRERGIEFSGYIQGVSLFNGKYEKSKPRGSKDVLHNLKPEYLPLFLNTAIEVVPEIALGIYIGSFGGLRNSEIVSIEYDNISFRYDKDGIMNMTINLVDKDLRPDIEYAFTSKVKKNRKQEVIPVYGGLLKELFDKHKEKYKKDNTNAVFIDEKGLPMTGRNYANKFLKFKKKFISKLEQSDSIDARAYAVTLRNYKWSTHICRGIFSNNIADSSKNIGDIAIWRGDSNYASALTYLNNKEEIGKSVAKTLDELYKGDIL